MNWFLPPYKAHVFLAECSNVSTWPFLVGSFLVNWLLSVWPWPFQRHGCPPSAVWPGWQTSAACQHITLAVQMQTRSFSITHKHKCAELCRDVTENRGLQDIVSISGCNNARSCILFRLAGRWKTICCTLWKCPIWKLPFHMLWIIYLTCEMKMSHHVNWTFSQRFDCFHRWMEMSSLETLANINYIHAFTHVD